MTPEAAKFLMESQMSSARQSLTVGDLSDYMRGYYIGTLFAYANAAATPELRALYELFRAELRNAAQVTA